MNETVLRVVLADDHPMMRSAFRTILEAHGHQVVGEAGDGRSAVELARVLAPDVMLLDIRMPVMDGLAAARLLRDEAPGVRVLVLTTFDDDELLDAALRAGVAGFVLKNSTPEEILRAVARVGNGESVLDPAVTARVIGRFADRVTIDDRVAIDRLTEREKDVLYLMANGLSNAEIADRLAVSEATAKTHISRVLTKLAVRDRVQAVIHAYRCGFAAEQRHLG